MAIHVNHWMGASAQFYLRERNRREGSRELYRSGRSARGLEVNGNVKLASPGYAGYANLVRIADSLWRDTLGYSLVLLGAAAAFACARGSPVDNRKSGSLLIQFLRRVVLHLAPFQYQTVEGTRVLVTAARKLPYSPRNYRATHKRRRPDRTGWEVMVSLGGMGSSRSLPGDLISVRLRVIM